MSPETLPDTANNCSVRICFSRQNHKKMTHQIMSNDCEIVEDYKLYNEVVLPLGDVKESNMPVLTDYMFFSGEVKEFHEEIRRHLKDDGCLSSMILDYLLEPAHLHHFEDYDDLPDEKQEDIRESFIDLCEDTACIRIMRNHGLCHVLAIGSLEIPIRSIITVKQLLRLLLVPLTLVAALVIVGLVQILQ